APPLSAAEPPASLASCALVRAENDGVGGGFVVDDQKRWLVTCRHVVADRDRVDVLFPWVRDGELVTDKQEYLGNRARLREEGLLVTGKVLKKSDEADLALVELESLPLGVKPIRFAAEPARPGDRLRVIGHRTDLDTLWNLTTGPARVSGRLTEGYPWRGKKLAVNADVLIGQLPIEGGDSGGPVLNDRGELVGVASALRRQAPLAAVAISAAEIRKFLDADVPAAKAEPAAIVETLTRATVWVRPSATEFHLAGVLIERNFILTAARGLGSSDRVGVAFPLRDGGRWVSERAPYRDPVGLHLRGAWRAGEVIAKDPDRDLALIRVDSIPDDARPVSLAAKLPNPGDAVHAMNHPGGLEFAWVYSAGTVRQRGRLQLTSGDDARPVCVHLYQLPTQSGSPGGPVLNDRGELLGVLSAGEGVQLVGYAATTDEIRQFLAAAPPDTPHELISGLLAGIERTVLFARATGAMEAKNWRVARGDLERILEPYPADAEARQKLIGVLLELGKDDEAASAVANTLRADPKRLPAVAGELLSQADALAKKYPDSPSAAADWLRKALTAAQRAPLDSVVRTDLEAALKQAAAAKTDAERLAILREFTIRLAKSR
ncbi:MAG TPA: trypsin-like peptidase domain-containing protein, partial [Gemmataceae bacterium]|nr:trypsin-like peptidase domain-containing protein [Gemmataceae bacterium]